MPMVLRTQVALPANYRPQDMLALHARDALQASEKVEGLRVSKGLVWQGQPALLQLEMVDGAARAALVTGAAGVLPPTSKKV